MNSVVRYRIGDSFGDIQLLLEHLEGEERPATADRIFRGLVALLSAAAPIYLGMMLFRERTYSWGWWLTAAVVAWFPWVVGELLMQAIASYVVARDHIARITPLGFGSWRIDRGNIFAIDLDFVNEPPILHIVPRSGRTRRMELLPGFRERLAALYPEIAAREVNPKLAPWLGKVMYTILAIVAVGFVVALVVTIRSGLVTW